MSQQAVSITERFNQAKDLIEQARATANPFKAKDLKNQLEPMLEELVCDSVELLTSLEARLSKLEKDHA